MGLMMSISTGAFILSIISVFLAYLSFRFSVTGTPEMVKITHRKISCVKTRPNREIRDGTNCISGYEFTCRNRWKQTIWIQSIMISVGGHEFQRDTWHRMQYDDYTTVGNGPDRDREIKGHTAIYIPVACEDNGQKKIKIKIKIITQNGNSFPKTITHKF